MVSSSCAFVWEIFFINKLTVRNSWYVCFIQMSDGFKRIRNKIHNWPCPLLKHSYRFLRWPLLDVFAWSIMYSINLLTFSLCCLLHLASWCCLLFLASCKMRSLFWIRISGLEPSSVKTVIVSLSKLTASFGVDSIDGFGLPSDSTCSGRIDSSDGYEFIGERAFPKLVPSNFPSITCSDSNKYMKIPDYASILKFDNFEWCVTYENGSRLFYYEWRTLLSRHLYSS